MFSADAGRSVACGYGSTTLQCCSGQVLAVNGGFHALENTYYCWSRQPSLTAPPQVQCGWVDVTKSLTGTQRLDAVFYRVVFVSIKCKAVARSRGVQIAECRMGNSHSAGLSAALLLLFHGPTTLQIKHLDLVNRFCVDEYSDETPFPSVGLVCHGIKAPLFLRVLTRDSFCFSTL